MENIKTNLTFILLHFILWNKLSFQVLLVVTSMEFGLCAAWKGANPVGLDPQELGNLPFSEYNGVPCEKECQLGYFKTCEPFYKDHCETVYSTKCEQHYVEKCENAKKEQCKDHYEEVCTYIKQQKCERVYEDSCDQYGKYCQKIPTEKCKTIDVPKCRNVPKHVCVYIDVPRCYKVPKQHCHKIPEQRCQKTKHYKAVKNQYKHCKKEYKYYTFDYKEEYKEECTRIEVPKCETKIVPHCEQENKKICKPAYKDVEAYEEKNHCETIYKENCESSLGYGENHYGYEKECKRVPQQKCHSYKVPKIKRILGEECAHIKVPKCHSVRKLHCAKQYKQECKQKPIKVPFKKQHKVCYLPAKPHHEDDPNC